MSKESHVKPASRMHRAVLVHAAWLAAGALAVVMACGAVVEGRVTCGVRADSVVSIAATHPGGHRGVEPLAIPPMVETEITVDDVDPNDASSQSWCVASHASRAVIRADGAGHTRRVPDPAVLVANAADLNRLCRFLL